MATSSRSNFRAIALALALLFVLFTVAVPVRGWIQQRREISALNEQIAQNQAAIDELKSRKARLKDPAYVQALARDRLNYVFPGEVGFVVLDEETSTKVSEVPGALVPNDDSAWYSKLWASAQLADQPQKKNDPLIVQSK